MIVKIGLVPDLFTVERTLSDTANCFRSLGVFYILMLLLCWRLQWWGFSHPPIFTWRHLSRRYRCCSQPSKSSEWICRFNPGGFLLLFLLACATIRIRYLFPAIVPWKEQFWFWKPRWRCQGVYLSLLRSLGDIFVAPFASLVCFLVAQCL